jgi:hypothetical protein
MRSIENAPDSPSFPLRGLTREEAFRLEALTRPVPFCDMTPEITFPEITPGADAFRSGAHVLELWRRTREEIRRDRKARRYVRHR